jgi:hypothetical protein
VRNEQHGLRRLPQLPFKPAFARHVQVVVRLVEQQHLVRTAQQRLQHQPLLLATGKCGHAPPLGLVVGHAEGRHGAHVPDRLCGVPARVGPVAQRLRVGQLGGLVVALHDRQFGRVHRAGGVADARPGHGHQQVPDRPVIADRPDELRHHAQPAAGRDRTRLRLQLPGNDLQQRALARTVRADQRQHVPLPDPEARVAEQHPPVGQVVVDMRDLQMAHARHHGRRAGPGANRLPSHRRRACGPAPPGRGRTAGLASNSFAVQTYWPESLVGGSRVEPPASWNWR